MLKTRGLPIAEGDTILLFFGIDDIRPLTVKCGSVLICKEGKFPHENFVGALYGSHVIGLHTKKNDVGELPSILVLQNSAALWTLAVPHRTQIIYGSDISMICFKLKLRPGFFVAEAGTGSGSLTHSLAQAVAPNGKVFTYDFHKVRSETAKAEFASNGLQKIVVASHSDICKFSTEEFLCPPEFVLKSANENDEESHAGYGLAPATLDAVFLDVPSPWLAVDNVLHTLKEGGMICSFSPCIEQTQKLCDRLRMTAGSSFVPFVDVETVECVSKQYDMVLKRKYHRSDHCTVEDNSVVPLVSQPCSRGHTAFLTFARRRFRAPRSASSEAPAASEAAVVAAPLPEC